VSAKFSSRAIVHTKFSDFMNWCNQVIIHFAGLADTKLAEKTAIDKFSTLGT